MPNIGYIISFLYKYVLYFITSTEYLIDNLKRKKLVTIRHFKDGILMLRYGKIHEAKIKFFFVSKLMPNSIPLIYYSCLASYISGDIKKALINLFRAKKRNISTRYEKRIDSLISKIRKTNLDIIKQI